MVFAEVGDEHRFAQRAENIHPLQKVLVIYLVAVGQVFERHFHQGEHVPALHVGFLDKVGLGAPQHVQRHFGHGPEAAALDQDALFVKGIGWLHDLAVGGEQGGVGQAALHQFERHEPVVQALEGRPGELDHIHLNPFEADIVRQGFDERDRVAVKIQAAVNQIDSDNPQRLLFGQILFIPEPDMQPSVSVVLPRITPGHDRIGKHKEAGGGAALFLQTFLQQGVLVIQHCFQPLAADIPLGAAVNGVADDHVVGRNGFGDGAGGAADAEKPPGHFLSRADFREGAVFGGVQIDLERLLMRAWNFALHEIKRCFTGQATVESAASRTSSRNCASASVTIMGGARRMV